MKKINTVFMVIILLFTCDRMMTAQNQSQTIADIVETIHQKLDIKFIYDSSINLDIPYNKPLPDLSDKNTEKIMEEIFAGSGLEYEIHKKYIILKKKTRKENSHDDDLDTTTVHLLDESRITDWKNRKVALTQTGYKKISGGQLRGGVSFLSQPDVVKNLQLLPGVASGTELLSGLYVHGGDGRDNLFQMDGVEIYSVSHLAGLFSSFNVDAIDHLEFYKSGFPARYGGKLSSVIDVSTKEGNLYEHHGTFSIGLLNGSIQVDGPLVKGKTTYNFGLRRSWLEPFTVPVFAIMNKRNPDHKKMGLRYSMSDLNASITHRFKDNNKLSFNLYAGQDVGTYHQIVPTVEYWNQQRFLGENRNEFGMKWGNLLASLNWKYAPSEQFSLNAIGYYTQSMTHVIMEKQDWKFDKMIASPTITENFQEDNNRSKIQDAGIKADFFYEPDRGNHLSWGTDLKMHFYHASQDIDYHQDLTHATEELPTDKTTFFKDHSQSKYLGGEAALFVEDEIGYLSWLKANVGARYVAFFVPGKTYHRLEPRLAVRLQFCPQIALKASYTEMNQFTHKMSSHTLELPTFSFLPSNDKISPMHSRQIAGGLYTRLPYGIIFNVEGFYKTMNHLMEYKGINSYAPTVTDWQIEFSEGQGRAYGMEVELSWKNQKTDLSAYYTLSWNERYFGDLYHQWFPDNHDNRHKLTFLFTQRFSKHFDMNISWHYHTGDRITEGEQFTMEKNPHYDSDDSYIQGEQPPSYVHRFYNTTPNNFQLPAYHRMDIGFNWRKTTRNGNESIWNLSLYNAYCHVNAIFAETTRSDTGKAEAYRYGFIPIIPMFSWTLKF